MTFGNTNLPHYTYTLNQFDETYYASICHILRGEKPLLPDDRVWIKDVASALTREITLAEEHLTRLQAHCNAARQHLALYHSAVAPVRGLPRDVLVSIFEHTFDEDYCPTDVGKPPWTLGQVCHSWRDIVMSSSSLWAIVKYNSKHDTRDTATATEVMQEYLRRSGQHPLIVVLEGDHHAPVYNLILKESHRWKLLPEPKPLLFKPSNGKFYQRSDYKYVCGQQPLPMDNLPEYLHTFDKGWTPPKLWLAWASDLASLLKCVEKAYPSCIMRTNGDKGEIIQTSVAVLPEGIREDFVADPELDECIQIVTVALENGKHATALTMGCTHIGMLHPKVIALIQAKLGFEEPPKWYIDPMFWMWREQL